MSLKVWAYRTQFRIIQEMGEMVKTSGLWWAQAHRVPDWYWGTFMVFRDAPQAGDLGRWEKIWQTYLSETPHFSFTWNRTDGHEGIIQPFLDKGYTRFASTTYLCESRLGPLQPLPGLDIRPVITDAEWEEVLALQSQVDGEKYLGGRPGYKRQQLAAYRDMARQDTGAWIGAWLDGKLVGDCGLFDGGDGIATFQLVETHPDYRRMGICTALMRQAGAWALGGRRFHRLLVVADSTYFAGALYQKIGFFPVEKTIELFREKRAEEIIPLRIPQEEFSAEVVRRG